MISDAYPHLAKQADELCLLNGMQTNNPGHHQAVVALHTGNENFVRPSVGAWVTYGLGSEAEDLPGFVTIDPISDKGGAANYGSSFLPATFQGTRQRQRTGHPPENQQKVFQRFFRLDPARTRQRGGTGLGLAIVKHLMTLHGGTVHVESELGKGSTFVLDFS